MTQWATPGSGNIRRSRLPGTAIKLLFNASPNTTYPLGSTVCLFCFVWFLLSSSYEPFVEPVAKSSLVSSHTSLTDFSSTCLVLRISFPPLWDTSSPEMGPNSPSNAQCSSKQWAPHRDLESKPDFTREKSVADQLKSSQAPPYWDRESMRRRNCRSGAKLANKKHFAFTHPSRKVGQHHEVLASSCVSTSMLLADNSKCMWMMKNETESPLRECIAKVAPKLPAARSVRIQPSWKWDNTKCSNVDWVLLAPKTLPYSNVSISYFQESSCHQMPLIKCRPTQPHHDCVILSWKATIDHHRIIINLNPPRFVRQPCNTTTLPSWGDVNCK